MASDDSPPGSGIAPERAPTATAGMRSRLGHEGIVLGFLAMTLWSIGDGIWKHVLSVVAIPAAFFLTYATSSIALLACARRGRRSLRPRRAIHAAVYALLYFLELGVFFIALARMPIVDLFVIILTTPLFVLICARLVIGERLTRLQVASVFTGFVGAAVVAFGWTGAAPLASLAAPALVTPVGIALPAVSFAIANVVFNGSKIVYLRKYCKDEDPFALAVCFNLAVALVMSIPALPRIPDVPTPMLLALVTTGLLQVVGQVLYLRALQIEQAPLVAATQYSQVVWALLIGTVFFAEPLRPAALGGAMLVVASGLMLYGRHVAGPGRGP